MRDFVALAGGGFWETDSSFRLTFVSEDLARQAGLAAAQCLGRPLGQMPWATDEEAGTGPLVDALTRRQAFENLVYWTRDAAGQRRCLRVAGRPVLREGPGPVRYRGRCDDITDETLLRGRLQRTDQLFQDLIESSLQGIMVHRAWRPLYANRALADALGYASPAELLALEDIRVLLPAEEAERVTGYWQRRVRGEDAPDRYELQALCSDGSRVWLDLFARMTLWNGEPAVSLSVVDVTERHVASERQRNDQQRLRDFAETASDWFWEQDAELRFTYSSVNAENSWLAADVLGRTRQELQIVDRDAAAWDEHAADLSARRPFRDFRYAVRDREGRRRHVSISGKPVFDADGTFRGYRGAGRDITEAMQREEELRRSEQRFRHFAEASADWLWEMDSELRYTWISDNIRKHSGDPPKSHYGKTRADIIDDSIDPAVLKQHEATLAARRPYSDFVMPRRTPKGLRWIRSSGVPLFDEHGNFQGYRGAGRDITEFKQAENRAFEAQQRLITAIESLPAAFTLFDRKLRLVMCNQTYRDWNPDVADLLVPGTPYEDIVRASVERNRVASARGRGQEYLDWRLNRMREPGDPFEIQMTDGRWLRVHEMRTADGGLVSVRVDVTELKRKEDELRLAKEGAERANQSKSDFLAQMSHELRTPLNAILGFSEVIKNELLGPTEVSTYVEYGRDIHSSGRHLLTLIDDLLDLSKIEAGKMELDETPQDVHALMQEAVQTLRPQAIQKNLAVQVDTRADLPPLIADRRAVKQMLLNLLINAIKFTDEGGEIRLDAVADAEGYALAIADNGCGIDPSDFARVLEPFGQIANTSSNPIKGTGLGLPIVKKLVELHGGELVLDSELDRGTTVYLRFPPGRIGG